MHCATGTNGYDIDDLTRIATSAPDAEWNLIIDNSQFRYSKEKTEKFKRNRISFPF